MKSSLMIHATIILLFIEVTIGCKPKESDPAPASGMATVTGYIRQFVSPRLFYKNSLSDLRLEHHLYPQLYAYGNINIKVVGTKYTALSDTLGNFNLQLPRSSKFDIIAERVGFASITFAGVDTQDSIKQSIHAEMYKTSKFEVDSLSVLSFNDSLIVLKFKVFDVDSGVYQKLGENVNVGGSPSIIFFLNLNENDKSYNYKYRTSGNFRIFNFDKYTNSNTTTDYLVAEINSGALSTIENGDSMKKLPKGTTYYITGYGTNYSDNGNLVQMGNFGYMWNYKFIPVYTNLRAPSNTVKIELK
ncbi:MAG: hypothetical protein SFY32_08230 [Bacteroidota bacterium]|nr:hypothetical protein [Bacteroidota bacterium]